MNPEFYDLVERAIDVAFEEDKYLFRCYNYLQSAKITRKQAREFIDSATANSVKALINDLEEYIKGGNKQLKEAYGHLGKPKARKIRSYLQGVLDDASRYEHDRRPGRKKRTK